MTNTSKFSNDLKRGEAAESFLDNYFANDGYIINPVDVKLQKLGVDRILIQKSTGIIWSVEYKADFIAHKTNNIFVETVSIDITNTPGWAVNSIAQLIVKYIPQKGTIIIIETSKLKMVLNRWGSQYKSRKTSTLGLTGEYFNSEGLLIPLPIFKAMALKTIETGQRIIL